MKPITIMKRRHLHTVLERTFPKWMIKVQIELCCTKVEYCYYEGFRMRNYIRFMVHLLTGLVATDVEMMVGGDLNGLILLKSKREIHYEFCGGWE